MLGHTARAAYDGAGAVESFEQRVPQVVLLDLSMPGMTGFDVIQRMRATSARRDHCGDDRSRFGRGHARTQGGGLRRASRSSRSTCLNWKRCWRGRCVPRRHDGAGRFRLRAIEPAVRYRREIARWRRSGCTGHGRECALERQPSPGGEAADRTICEEWPGQGRRSDVRPGDREGRSDLRHRGARRIDARRGVGHNPTMVRNSLVRRRHFGPSRFGSKG